MITQIKFVGVPVRDQDRALAFYRDKLGCKVKTDQPFNDTQRWIELKIPGAAGPPAGPASFCSLPTATRTASAASSTVRSPATT